MSRRVLTPLLLIPVFIISGLAGVTLKPHPQAASSVPGESYQICGAQSAQYLTSPWTYNALASGSHTYTVAQFEALPGYGTTLPPLPSYISSQSSGTEAAMILAPGSTDIADPAYDFPNSPILFYFEGGNYGQIGLQSVSGDEFIGGSANGFPEPVFNDGGNAAGINAQNDTYDSPSNTTAIGHLTAAAAQGATTISVSATTIPEVQWGVVMIGGNDYKISALSGSESSGYTLTLDGGLDMAAASNAPVYYDGLAGSVTVSYLNINNDQHGTTGTIYTGSGWTITNNDIHDGYSTPGNGVAIYGGDQGTIEYNCLSKMGDYGLNVFGTNNKFDYNEIYETNYEPDPGCGCSGGGKWWGSLNADIVDNAFINDGYGGGGPIWLDNGNSGTQISGNYFYKNYGDAISSETGFNLDITNNLFENDNWGTGSGCGDSNCAGDIVLNSSGGFHVPNSRYDNQIIISSNQFINDWGGVAVWQSGGRSCENSGEGWPYDAPYCSGGYPNTSNNNVGGQYYFSHYADSSNGGDTTVAQAASAGSTSLTVVGSQATNDQVGIGDPGKTTTTSTTNVTSLTGSQSINAASTSGFPSSGQLRVGTSSAWSDGNGSWTGAILSYSGTTSTSFTGVSLVRGSGTLSGPVWQVQPYKVTSETCFENNCKLSITPALTSAVSAGENVTNAGTCQLYATSAATPTSPLAPGGASYFDGCQWGTANISISGNSFDIDPTYINSQTALNGGTTSCTAANNCGTNFMAFQEAGEPPFNTFIGGNAMVSRSSLTGCPSWDSGCSSNPLTNINALTNPPSAPANNNEPPENNVWSNNAYYGVWTWNTYWYGYCSQVPTDPTTNKTMPGGACQVNFANWQADWQQDTGSTYTSTPNSNPPPPAGKVGDFNNDGSVNISDLSMLLSAWGTNNSTILTNLGQSGTVNITCLSIFLSHWGT
jgi:Right handed beta helix region